MSHKPAVAEIVEALAGSWHGLGEGGYPTIEPFTFRESTRFTTRADHPAVLYEQRTWRQTPDGEVASHWETGLVRISSDGSVTVNNAQGGRTEVLAGTWARSGDAWIIELQASDFAGDARMVASSRTITLTDRFITYDMYMQTTATSDLILHLHADLTRIDPNSGDAH